MKPRLLDLFAGAGGAAQGYADAGFEVVGVDIKPQPRYPFEFIQADVRDFLHPRPRRDFSAVHASPPCQRFSKALDMRGDRSSHPDLVASTRECLRALGLPYVIENVPGAPLDNPVMLCGSSFGLDLRRHRLFETNFPLLVPGCSHGWQTPRFPSTPRADGSRPLAPVVNFLASDPQRHERFSKAMGINWMRWDELCEAVPPAYCEFIGLQLIDQLRRAA